MSQPQYESGVLGAGQWVGVGSATNGDVNQASRPQTGAGGGGSAINPPGLVGQMSCGISISGTWTGTLVFEGTMDGTNYQATAASPFGGGAPVTSTTANGLFVANLSGCTGFRVRASADTVNAPTVVLSATDAQPPQGAGMSVASGLSSTATISFVNSLAAGQTLGNLLSANPQRQGAIIANESTAPLMVALGNTAFATAYSFSVAAGASLTLPPPDDFTGPISGVWLVSAGNAKVTELKP